MMKLTQILQKTAHDYPDRPGVTFNDVTLSWSQYLERCEKLAGGLQKLGVAKGDRLAILSHNSTALAELFYGPLWLGAVPVPINWRWAMPELVACLEDCTPTVLLVDDHFIEQARELKAQCNSLQTLVYLGHDKTPEGFVSYEKLVAEGKRINQCPNGDDDLAVMIYTGGTTGRSKGVMLSHSNLYSYVMGYLELENVGDPLSILLSGPMFHISSCGRVFWHTFMATHMVILSQFDPLAAMENIQKYRLTSAILISSMSASILDHPRYAEFDLSSLKRINYGAAPMPPSLIRRLRQEFPGVSFYHAYGSTETCGTVTTLLPKDHIIEGNNAQRVKSIGKPQAYLDLRVVDPQGKEVADNTVGEIVVRGSSVMKGYWNMPEATAKALQDDWYHTGDAAYRDNDGFLYLVDRMKDMIITGGENVYSIEVERAIDLHPAVKQCAVVGQPDEQWGEIVFAVVTVHASQSISSDELREHCRQHIAGYKCPRRTEIWDTLPLSPAGKILKHEIRERIGDDVLVS